MAADNNRAVDVLRNKLKPAHGLHNIASLPYINFAQSE